MSIKRTNGMQIAQKQGKTIKPEAFTFELIKAFD